MKKIIKFFVALLLLLTTTSCNTDEINTKFMIKGNIENTQLVNLKSTQLKDMILNEESFVLIILLNTCSSCEAFKNNVVKPYIEETYSTMYAISSFELDSSEHYDNKPTYKVAPTIAIYNKGKIKNILNYKNNNNVFKNIDSFANYLSQYCIEPRLIELSEEKTDQKIISNDSFVLYIGWNKCGDCGLFESEVLNEHLKNNDVTMYYLESDKYRSLKPAQEPILSDNPTQEELLAKENWDNWIEFASKYSFVSYRDGKVPVILYYENGIVIDWLVYHNDVIINGIVNESFFEELIGQSFTDEQLIKEHNQKALNFLNKYLK